MRKLNTTQMVATIDVETTMARLGIKRPRVVLDIYARTIEQRERDAADAVGDFFNDARRTA